jgi:hypothetical protein
MSDYVWMSTAMGRASIMLPMTHSFADDPQQFEQARATRGKNDAGESISPEFFPDAIYGKPNATESTYKLPNIFFAGSFWVVSKAAADVLSQFDLGGGGLYPVKVFKKDRVTPVEGEWFCINFGNVKQAFLPDESANAWDDYIRPGIKGWNPSPAVEDGDFVLSSSVNIGADIWIDGLVGDAFFLSAALGDALKKAKVDKGLFLTKCWIV